MLVKLAWSVNFILSFFPLLPLSTYSSIHPPSFSPLPVLHIHAFFTHLIQPFVLLSLPHYPQFHSSPSISTSLHQPEASPILLSSLLFILFFPLQIAYHSFTSLPLVFSTPSLPPFPLPLSVSPDNCVQALVRVPPPRTN